MATRMLVRAALPALLLTASPPFARADDGCDVLKERVRAHIYVSARGPSFAGGTGAGRRAGAVGSTLSGSQTCVSTAQAASRGFSEALAALHLPVTWSGDSVNPGDGHCLSHDLDRCYPFQHPLQPSLPPNQVSFIHDAWAAVRRSIASQMPFGTAAGVSQFTMESLDAALSSSLRASVDGALDSGYQAFEGARTRR